MYHKIRQVHCLNVATDQVNAAITDVDTEELEKTWFELQFPELISKADIQRYRKLTSDTL